MLDKLSRREKIILLIGLVVLVLGLYYLLLYQPLEDRKNALKQEINNLELEQEQALAKLRQISELEEELEALEREEPEINYFNITTKEEFLLLLYNKLEEENIKIISYNSSPGEELITLNLSLEGDYFSFLNFMEEIFADNYPVEISNLNIQRNDNNLDINLVIKYYKEQLIEG